MRIETVRALFESATAAGDVALTEATTPAAATKLLEGRPFDLIVLAALAADTAIGHLKAFRGARGDAKVIVISADAAAEAVLAAIREHAFAYFHRPFAPADVGDAVAQALGVRDWQDGIEVLSARPEWVSLRLRCQRLTADRVLRFLSELRVDLTPEDRASMGAAVREILLNAIEHGGGLDPHRRVQISRIRAAGLILYHVQDPGPGFSPDALPHAAVSNPVDDPMAHLKHRKERGLRPGGFGILVARGLVDELLYSESGNEAVLIKYPKRETADVPDSPSRDPSEGPRSGSAAAA